MASHSQLNNSVCALNFETLRTRHSFDVDLRSNRIFMP